MIPKNALTQKRLDFFQRGESVAEWARRHEFPPALVYQVLSGRHRATRGIGHAIAMALGLKPQDSGAWTGAGENQDRRLHM